MRSGTLSTALCAHEEGQKKLEAQLTRLTEACQRSATELQRAQELCRRLEQASKCECLSHLFFLCLVLSPLLVLCIAFLVRPTHCIVVGGMSTTAVVSIVSTTAASTTSMVSTTST